jgi:hypothetical protein
MVTTGGPGLPQTATTPEDLELHKKKQQKGKGKEKASTHQAIEDGEIIEHTQPAVD